MEKLKSAGQFLVALSLAVVLSSGAVVPAHAAGFGGGERVGEFGSGGFGGTTVKTEISYNALSELCVIVNDQITQGLFEDVSPFCDTSAPLAATVRYDLDNGFYVISVKVGTTYYNLRNNSGGLYVAYEDSDSTLAGIWGFLSRIDLALTSENGPFALWMSLLDTDLNLVDLTLEEINLRIKSLVDYTNVIANGTVTLVEKMDELIEAVNGISISADGATINLDTLPIVNKLDDVITAIEDISINVEGGTVNFDTNPITDKLDEVISALQDISVDGAFCDHTFVDSGQYTYKTILPLTHYNFITGADAQGFHEIDFFELVEGETYQVNYNGDLYQYVARVTSTGANRIVYVGNTLSGGVSFDTPYPFSLKYHYVTLSGKEFTAIDPLTDTADISVSQRVAISYCSKCGAMEGGSDLLTLIGTINNAASAIHHAILLYTNTPTVSLDLSEVITILEQNHDDLCFGLSDFFEWVATESLIAPCEHSYMPVVMVEPSCDFPGVTKFICDYCDTFRMELSAPLGHEWEGDDEPETVSPVPLLEDAPFGLIEGSSPPMLGNYQVITLAPGMVYTVIYEGTEYVTECSTVPFNGLTVPVIGNVDAYLGTGNNGLPFIITSADALGGSGCIDFSGATFVRLSIYEGTFPSDTEEEESAGHSLRVCTRCESGHNLAALMEFLDTRLVPGSGGGGSIDVSPVVDKLTSIENALSNLGGDVNIENNTNIEVSEDNDNYNIFYVDDPDGGDDQSIVDLSGDALRVFGKLLNFLYQVGFKDALDGAGPGIGDLSDFYLDNAEGSADLWAS